MPIFLSGNNKNDESGEDDLEESNLLLIDHEQQQQRKTNDDILNNNLLNNTEFNNMSSLNEEDKASLEMLRKWASSRSVTNPELFSILIRYMTCSTPYMYEKHCEFVEKIKTLFINYKPSSNSLLEEQHEELETEEHGRKWSKERWVISLQKELKLFDPNNPKRHHPQAYHINSKYMSKANTRDRYRRFFAKYPALFYIYKYTFFSGTITMVSEILENSIELKKKAEYLPTSFKTW